MSYLKGALEPRNDSTMPPIDPKIYISLPQKIAEANLLNKTTLWKIMLQMSLYFKNFELFNQSIDSNAKLDHFYLSRVEESNTLFFTTQLFSKEAKFYQDQNCNILKKLILKLGTDPKAVDKFHNLESIIEYFENKLEFDDQNRERLQLEQVFGFKIIDQLFTNQYTTVYEIETPIDIQQEKTQEQTIIIKLARQAEPSEFTNEIKLNQNMRKTLLNNQDHNLKQLPQIYCFTMINSKQFILLEKKYWRTLSQFIIENQTRITVEQKLMICLNIAGSLKIVHKANVIHRDIKPDNIMAQKTKCIQNDKVWDAEYLNWIMIDYDRSTENRTQAEEQNLYIGTQDYRPPELVENNLFEESYDIWQLGMCFLFIMNERKIEKYGKVRLRPYPKEQYDALLIKGLDNLKNPEKKYCYSPNTMYDLIKSMTSYNPKDRPKLKEVQEILTKRLAV